MSWDWTQIDWRAGWDSLPVTLHAGRMLLKIGGVTQFQLTILLWVLHHTLCVCLSLCVTVQIAELLAELADERGTSESATQLLETETSERLRLEKDLKELQVHTFMTSLREETAILKERHFWHAFLLLLICTCTCRSSLRFWRSS